jgi:hypothetical protein
MAYIGKSPTGTGIRQRYYFTATGSETSLSGTDDNNLTLSFSDGAYVDVYLNGVLLVAGTDYNTSTANTISGLSALAANDIAEIVVYDVFTVADTVSAKDGGTFSGNIDVTGTITSDGLTVDSSTASLIENTSGSGIARLNIQSTTNDGYQHAGIGLKDGTNQSELMLVSGNNFAISHGGSERVRITSDGNVGIGTSSPTTTSGFETGKFIEVENSGTASDATDNASIQIKSDSRHSLLSLMSNSAYSGYINFGDGDDNDVGQIRYNHSNNTLRLRVNGGEVATLNGTGQLLLDSEGGSNLTVNVQQGSAKVWCKYNASHSVGDSFNVTSVTDGGTGRGTVTIATNMDNANYVVGFASSVPGSPAVNGLRVSAIATTSYTTQQVNNTGGYTDSTLHMTSVHGDLS